MPGRPPAARARQRGQRVAEGPAQPGAERQGDRLAQQGGGRRLVAQQLGERGVHVERGGQGERVAAACARRVTTSGSTAAGRRRGRPRRGRAGPARAARGRPPRSPAGILPPAPRASASSVSAAVEVAREDRRVAGQGQRLAGHRGSATRPARATAIVGVAPHPADVAGQQQQPEPAGQARQRATSDAPARSAPARPDPRGRGRAARGRATGCRRARRRPRRGRARAAAGRPSAGWRGRPRAGRASVTSAGPSSRLSGCRGARVEVRGMPVGGRRRLARGVQALHRVLPHRLEQPEPRLVVGGGHPQHERLLHQGAQRRQHVGARRRTLRSGHGLDRVEREARR